MYTGTLSRSVRLLPRPSPHNIIPLIPPTPVSPASHGSTPLPNLIVLRRILTSLQLLKIPPTNRHIAPVLVHTVRETLQINRTWLARLCARGRISVVRTRLCEIILSYSGRLRLLLCCGAGTAAEEPTDGVADRGADCDTTI